MIDQTSLEPVLATPEPEKRRRVPSLVWLMPLLALLVAGWVVWSNYQDRGPLITIAFDTASGIRAGATEVRIRDLRVGVVEEVGFSDGMAAVEARVRMDKTVARYLDADAQFWLVQPQVTARGVTGIGTLLSGVYIAANWDGEAGQAAESFVALPSPPLAATGEEGTRVVLRTRAGGQLAAGAPVLASGIEVGRIGQPVLSASGTTVTMEAFITKPYDRRLTTNARFWDASGLSVNVGAEGLAVKVDSLAALLEGGVTFGTPVTGGDPVEDGHVFEVFATQALARADAFEADTGPGILASILLDSDVNGLGVGSLVRFRGVKVGEVQDVVGIAPPEGSREAVKLRIDMTLSPARLGFPKNLRRESIEDALKTRVENGLRMRVAAEGLFGQTMVVELANAPGLPKAELERGDEGRLMFPTAPSVEADGDTGVNGLVNRVSNLPIEELMEAVTGTLNGVTELAGTVQGVVSSPSVARIPVTVDETLSDVRTLVSDIQNDGGIARLVGSATQAVESVSDLSKTAQGVLTADGMDQIPQTIDRTLGQIGTLIGDINRDGGASQMLNAATAALDGVTQLTGSVQTVVASDGMAKLPNTLDATLGDVRTLLAELQGEDAVGKLVVSATGALEGVTQLTGTAQGVLSAEGMDQIPQSVEQTLAEIRKLVTDISGDGKAAALVDSATAALKGVNELTGSAQTVLGAEGMQQLPVALNGTLAEVQKLLADLREGGAVENVNNTLRNADSALQSADSALKSVDAAARSLPELAKRLNIAADGLQGVVSGYNPKSRFYQDIRGTLREVSSAAESFRSLARSIERNPSSLIRGR